MIGIRAILPDGTKVKSGGRVVKNVAGYDLQKVLTGSFGSLGVIVEASFKLQPLPEEAVHLAFSAARLEPLFNLASSLAGSNLSLLFLEILVGPRPSFLAVGLAGVSEEVAEGRRRVREKAAEIQKGIEERDPPSREELTAEIEEVCRDEAGAVVFRAGVRPSALVDWFSGALEACRKASARVLAHAHAGVGVARFRLERPEAERLSPLIGELRRAALVREGYLVVESGPGGSRLDVWGPAPGSIHLMKGVKAAFDPAGILSPGRFVGGI